MIVRFNAESRQGLLAAAGVIPVFAKKRLSQKSSGRPSRRSRTLPALGTGGTSLRGDTPAPSSSIVAEAELRPFGSSLRSPHHSFGTVPPLPCRGWHVPQGCSSASAARCLVSAILLIMAVACSRPGSWEQFVKVEDAPGGVYEFVIPASVITPTTVNPSTSAIPSEVKEPSLRAMASSDCKSNFDLTFYTSPLSEPLQLEILWQVTPQLMAGNQLNTSNMPEAPLQPGVERRFYESADNQTVACHSETVWFPAGEHRALYRSGVRFSADLSGNTPKSLQVPPKNPLPVENIAEISTGTPKNTPTCIENGEKLYRSSVKIRVTPVNPPEGFRGLGIIIKRNDGTR